MCPLSSTLWVNECLIVSRCHIILNLKGWSVFYHDNRWWFMIKILSTSVFVLYPGEETNYSPLFFLLLIFCSLIFIRVLACQGVPSQMTFTFSILTRGGFTANSEGSNNLLTWLKKIYIIYKILYIYLYFCFNPLK